MKKIIISLLLSLVAITAFSKELVIFSDGKLNGQLASKAEIKNGKLRFSTSNAIKLKIAPATPDLSKYTQLEITVVANRANDQFRLTLTSNPANANKWNYYCVPGKFTFTKGPQKMIIDLSKLIKSRNPIGKHQIQTIDFNFTGWEMAYKKGLVLDIEKMVLSSKGNATVEASKKVVTDKKKILNEIKKLSALPNTPWTPVPNIQNRKFWDATKNTIFGKNVIKHAKKALKQKAAFPPTDYYLDFLRNGNRTRYENAYNPIVQNYANLTMALCITGDKATYFTPWQEYNDVLCKMATWVYPAHDKKLDNLLMRRPHIELVGSNVGAIVSTARCLLAPIISKETAQSMEQAVQRQIITPFIETVQGKRSRDYFLIATNNWNAVCIANVVQTLLASNMPSNLRKEAIAYALSHTENYLNGFNSDGYCSEGISYWSYGFGHYLRLAALLYAVSDGKLNLLDDPKSRLAASFPERFLLSEKDFYPAFADCSFDAGLGDVSIYLRDYLMGYKTKDAKLIASNMLYQLAVYALPPQNSKKVKQHIPQRVSEFAKTGVFIIRSTTKNGLNIACKGGNNNELHNHNDVGSFSIAFPGKHVIIGDLGGTVYTRNSFNQNRYQNLLLNSWGHPVPLINGKLQTHGQNTDAQVVKFNKTKEQVSITLDIKKAYQNNPEIKTLTRSFDYNFSGRGKITITDLATFTTPATFETALTTFGNIKQVAKDKLIAQYRDCAVEITVNTNGIPWKLNHDVIKANTRWLDTPKRYAITLDNKHKNVSIKMEIIPLDK